MDKEALKLKLLSTNLFIDNSYLDQYLNLVVNYTTDKEYTERHHILQRAYFSLAKLPLDSTKSNIVKLSYADHCKAHWLLYWCTKSNLKNANAYAILYMQSSYKKYTGKNKRKFEFSDEDFKILEYYWEQIRLDNKDLFWSLDDIEILKANYQELGAEGVQEKLKYKRSIQAIRLQASLLKLSAPIYWTDQEIENLKLWYPQYGYFCYKKFKNKTKGAVQAKAHRLGLDSKWAWSDSEIKLLKKYYPIYGYKSTKYIPGKSVANITSKAKELKLKNPYEKWTEYDLNILILNYKAMGVGCLKLMQQPHSISAIHSKAVSLGLHKGWSNEEIAIMIKHYPNYKLIGKELNIQNYEVLYSKIKYLKKKGLITDAKRESKN